MANLDENVFFDQSHFETLSSHIRAFGIEPISFIHFQVKLPIYLPITEETGLTIPAGDAAVTIFHFRSVTEQHTAYTGIIDDGPIITNKYSIIEMLYITNYRMSSPLSADKVTEYFTLLLGRLNAIISAYSIKFKEPSVYAITKEMLEVGLTFRQMYVPEWSLDHVGLLMLHGELPIISKYVTIT